MICQAHKGKKKRIFYADYLHPLSEHVTINKIVRDSFLLQENFLEILTELL